MYARRPCAHAASSQPLDPHKTRFPSDQLVSGKNSNWLQQFSLLKPHTEPGAVHALGISPPIATLPVIPARGMGLLRNACLGRRPASP